MKRLIFVIFFILLILCLSLSCYADISYSARYAADLAPFSTATITILDRANNNALLSNVKVSDLSLTVLSDLKGLNVGPVFTEELDSYSEVTLSFLFSTSMPFNGGIVWMSDTPGNVSLNVYVDGYVNDGLGNVTYTTNIQLYPVDTVSGYTKYDYSYGGTTVYVLDYCTAMRLQFTFNGARPVSSLGDFYIFPTFYEVLVDPNGSGVYASGYSFGYSNASTYYSGILDTAKSSSYDSGYNAGYSDAASIEYAAGYEAGDLNGYYNGYIEGSAATEYDLKDLIFATGDVQVKIFSSFLDWDLLGFNLLKLFGGIVVVVLLIFGIKVMLKHG